MSNLEFEQPFMMSNETKVNSTTSPDESPSLSHLWRQRVGYIIFLGSTLFISFLFQAGNLGWMKIIFGLLYLIAFGIHLAYWLVWLGKPGQIRPHDKALFFFTNLFFLAGNILNVDFGDVNSYMFFMQYTDPPEELIAIGFFAYIGWFILLVIDFIIRLIARAQKK